MISFYYDAHGLVLTSSNKIDAKRAEDITIRFLQQHYNVESIHVNDNVSKQNVTGWGNRDWVDILENILETCENGSLKTHIKYRCNLGSQKTGQYVQFLQDRNLIEGVPKSSKLQLFKTTKIGKRYIEVYKQIESIFKEP